MLEANMPTSQANFLALKTVLQETLQAKFRDMKKIVENILVKKYKYVITEV
jgi:hypothetical protein